MANQVFISYSHADSTVASLLVEALRERSIATWIDSVSDVGSSISQSVREQIARSDRVLLCLSKNSIASAWVAAEIELCLQRERTEQRAILLPLRLDDFDLRDWKSDLRHYLVDRKWVEVNQAALKRRSKSALIQSVQDAISNELSHSMLLQGTWGYRVVNATDRRLIVGAFRIERHLHRLVVPQGLSCIVTLQDPSRSFEKWHSTLVAYDGEELGIYFDCEQTGETTPKPYGIRTEGGWRLRHDTLTCLSGRAYHVLDELRASEIHVQINRLDVPSHRPPSLAQCLKSAFRTFYRDEVAGLRNSYRSRRGVPSGRRRP